MTSVQAGQLHLKPEHLREEAEKQLPRGRMGMTHGEWTQRTVEMVSQWWEVKSSIDGRLPGWLTYMVGIWGFIINGGAQEWMI